MYTIKSLLAPALIIVNVQLTIAGNPAFELELKAPKVTEYKTQQSIMFRDHIYTSARFNECKEFKQKQIAGFTILGVGVGSMGVGSYLAYLGGTHILNMNNTIHGSSENTVNITNRDKGLVIGGSALALFGLIVTPAGLAMGIRGSIMRHRYCNNYHTLYIRPASFKSIDLTYKF